MKRSLCILALLLTLCCKDDEESYPLEPRIALKEISFHEKRTQGEFDTLVFTITYTDGDGDFGLDLNTEHLSPPYHFGLFYSKNTGQPITFDKVSNGEAAPEELIRLSDRVAAPFDTLPPLDATGCHYTSLENVSSDFFYFTRNEDFYNIMVDYFYEDDQGVFVEFDWWDMYCASFDGRVHNGAIENGPFKRTGSAKKGEVTYSMCSLGFVPLFGTKKVKLRIRIRDRALHESNVIETPAFFLDDI